MSTRPPPRGRGPAIGAPPKGKKKVRVKLQIDSAGGHGTARGHGNFDKLANMMLKDFNVELVQQPGNSPFYNILDLMVWQAAQLLVSKMNGEARHRAEELVPVVIQAWGELPDVRVLQAFEMRKGCAAEATGDGGWCSSEGKGRGGARRVHEDAFYAQLRARLGL
jgi:hypothetical protein